MSERSLPDLDAEREIDLRSAWQRIAARWWLPVGALIIGAVLGVLLSVGGGKLFEAKTLLYLGQPFTPNGGGQIQSLATNPKTVSEIVHSESAIKDAAAAAGIRPGQLRGRIASRPIVSAGQAARALSPLVEITVQADTRAKAEKASASLSQAVLDGVSTYVEKKVTLLEQQIADDKRLLTQANERITSALQQQAALTAQGLSLAERILIQANVNSTLQFYEARTTNLRDDLSNAEQLLSLAQQVESSRVVDEPVAVPTTATSRRNAAVIGALIGLLLGALAANIADPILRRKRVTAQA